MVYNLIQPLPLLRIEQRPEQVRNENYFEETIPAYTDIQFYEHFRMSRDSAEELIQILGNAVLNPDNMRPLRKKLLFSIWVLSKQESFLATSDRFCLPDRSRRFPGVIGMIDGCHIPCKQPPVNEVDFYNRKGFH
ncbi:hypothetical protein NQ315_008285 [Exocentrus adspersus]|uniref:Nuclease HARBI1 n=1 Tax=Exocentrus adspersus TaxID=1586481 RepID=A0AAV8VN45_9CUCU|nr:hypothetical protein NQ315_008285 [Exocentrus adspersus]